ncbi:hypothetical protein C5C41_16520 [Rathayibacter sp. AY1E9]|nr:hypothetical protein C5B92_16300 [Rathayibacter sp. AY1A4]PPG48791.1 hypothetical protein C5C41_16520 [Rathayibacter sp. AY1E9]PPG56227.1 hypothetical protein C5C69_16320 [Rathayibacter sp. AY1C7]PPH32951.1 hypothetical protein C5C53_16610 [Rathayibacter sp. AY1E3]PPH41005.1 hypothetical protein C5D09_16880 [Rathayibacter sp. AY1C9]
MRLRRRPLYRPPPRRARGLRLLPRDARAALRPGRRSRPPDPQMAHHSRQRRRLSRIRPGGLRAPRPR